LDESFKLDPWALDGCPRPKGGKKLTWHHFGGKINWFGPKKQRELKKKKESL
jgi:hypothetical protein